MPCTEIRAGRWILQQGARRFARTRSVGSGPGGRPSAGRSGARVVFDRSFIDEEGVRWVIDYKTSQHQGSGLEEFLDREVERYRSQLQRYAVLAKKTGSRTRPPGVVFSADAGLAGVGGVGTGAALRVTDGPID